MPARVTTGEALFWPAETEEDRARRQAIARLHVGKVSSPVSLAVLDPAPREWDAAWVAYDALRRLGPAGRRVLVPGCGFGEDAIRLATMGFQVHATDPAPELLEIARSRARHLGVAGIVFEAGALPEPGRADGFDAVFFDDMLHHADIPALLAATRAVLKPGGLAVVNEHYTHASIQRIRDSRLVAGHLHHRMVGFIYGSRARYVSGDGHKIDQHELAQIDACFAPGRAMRFFSLFGGRVLPAGWRGAARLDHALLGLSAGVGRLLAGRVVVAGALRAG